MVTVIKTLEKVFWLVVVTVLVYYNFIVLTDQIIAGKL